ncbi:MAG: peptidase M28, partial [Bacteroidota bacterium]
MHRFQLLFLSLCYFLTPLLLFSQEKTDTAMISKIKNEGMNNSKVMEILAEIADENGPRLTGSPNYFQAAEWAKNKFTALGLDNSHFERWGTFGRGWQLQHFSAHV